MAGPSVRTIFDTRAGTSSRLGADTGRLFVAGLFQRGRTDSAVVCRSFKDVTDQFGDRTPYGHAWDALRTFFSEGGAEAVVARVVGPAAQVGSATLKDGSGVDALRVDALGGGAWSSTVTVQIMAGAVAGTVRAVVRSGEAREIFDGATSTADLANKLLGSRFVRGVDMGSGALPAATPAPVALSAGTDDRSAVTVQLVVDALNMFPASMGTGSVALPGYSADLVGLAVREHCKTTRRVGIVAPPVGATGDDVKAIADDLTGPDGKYLLLAAPWVRVPVAAGVTALTPPEGYVAGARSRAHTSTGPWAAAAGMKSAASTVVDVEREVTQTEYDNLSDAGVSCVVTRQGQVVLYGYRSLSNDPATYAMLTVQDTLNWLAQRCEDELQRFLFQPIDGSGGLLAQVDGALRGILEDVRFRGGVYARVVDGNMVDPGYSVDVGNGVNTPESLATNTLRAVVAVRVSPVAEFIELTIIRAALNAAV